MSLAKNPTKNEVDFMNERHNPNGGLDNKHTTEMQKLVGSYFSD
jgi:hypothetical protein